MLDELLDDARERMTKAVAGTQGELATVRAGRASTNVLDRVQVDYHGVYTPLKQLATLSAPEPRLLTVSPYDPGSMKMVEKAISDAQLGLTPSNDGKIIRLTVPELTEERRRDLVKQARGIAEEGRVRVRNVRREVMGDLKELKDEGEVGADDEHRAEQELQKRTDAAVAELDALLETKEKDILEV